MHIDDATSIGDHKNKATKKDFFLFMKIPTTGEVSESIGFISNTGPNKIRTYRGSQLRRVAEYFDITKGARRIWGNSGP